EASFPAFVAALFFPLGLQFAQIVIVTETSPNASRARTVRPVGWASAAKVVLRQPGVIAVNRHVKYKRDERGVKYSRDATGVRHLHTSRCDPRETFLKGIQAGFEGTSLVSRDRLGASRKRKWPNIRPASL